MSVDGIEFVNVTKSYGTKPGHITYALQNINLNIKRGEYIGLAGANGSGKTTLARMMNALLTPTSGRVYVNGLNTSDASKVKEIRRRVGMVFQNPDDQIVSSVVAEDIAFGPENLGLEPIEVKRRVDWALSVVRLEGLSSFDPHLLSGGQKQRVAIAAALAMLPSYLVLDEPASMLDGRGRSELLRQLSVVNRRYGIAIILISNQMEDLVEAEHLIVLREGRVFLQGPPEEVLNARQELEQADLRPPEIVQLAERLRCRGHHISKKVLTGEQMVQEAAGLLIECERRGH